MKWTKEKLIEVWNNFTENNDFKLNPDKEHVDLVAIGVLKNEENTGWKLCPCRLPDGSYDKNKELLCPCNFKTHDTWKNRNDCWCGLFVKK